MERRQEGYISPVDTFFQTGEYPANLDIIIHKFVHKPYRTVPPHSLVQEPSGHVDEKPLVDSSVPTGLNEGSYN
jgi:hypothetical protein